MNKKKQKIDDVPSFLSHTEWTLISMATRYAVGRSTIESAYFPPMIIREFYGRLTYANKKELVLTIDRYLELYKIIGHENIDHPIWLTFRNALDESTHKLVTCVDGSRLTVFEVLGNYVPLDMYLKHPNKTVIIPRESILES